nr:hypothetical protein [Clostridiales bacterium]
SQGDLCVSRYPTDRWSSQNYLNILMFLRFVHSLSFVLFILTIRFSRYPLSLALGAFRLGFRDSLCIIALSSPFVNTFFLFFLPIFIEALCLRFSLFPYGFLPCRIPRFKNKVSDYILKYIGGYFSALVLPDPRGHNMLINGVEAPLSRRFSPPLKKSLL